MPASKGDRRGMAVAAGLLGLCVAASSGARAADDGYANVFSSVLGSVGLIKGDASPDIQYRERPPLVLPKDAALPKPQVGGVKHVAAWPQDPDVLKKRKEAAEAHAPHTLDPSLSDHGGMLTRDEQMKGRIAATEDDQPVRPNNCGNDGQHCMLLSREELDRQSDAYRAANPDKQDKLVAGQEPTRDFLTQPPKGYMKPVKSVKATAEAPEEKLDESNPRYMQQQEAKHRADVEQ
ncbi:hypothetical protein D3273_01790 [Lichenibacterium minor]|jgi:hypothetical protein|uniref:Uncharacterized protein n=1 Tax=Lichenibacterium minor TaxID=2316528 RepID=A0A4Q2UFK4_9HYPH|nr:hypothetical protein [Lichenibacterium minor]RYC34007.1 hypothetical protein D3273_01790 [Lichenibacterium minor]